MSTLVKQQYLLGLLLEPGLLWILLTGTALEVKPGSDLISSDRDAAGMLK